MCTDYVVPYPTAPTVSLSVSHELHLIFLVGNIGLHEIWETVTCKVFTPDETWGLGIQGNIFRNGQNCSLATRVKLGVHHIGQSWSMACSTSVYWTCELCFEWSAQMEQVVIMDLTFKLIKINLTVQCFRLWLQSKKFHVVVSQFTRTSASHLSSLLDLI